MGKNCYCLSQKALGTGRWARTVIVCHRRRWEQDGGQGLLLSTTEGVGNRTVDKDSYCLPQKALGTGRWTRTLIVYHRRLWEQDDEQKRFRFAISQLTQLSQLSLVHFISASERERQRQTDRHTDTQTHRQTDRQTETERKLILYYTTIKKLSTSRLFYKSVPDDKHNKTQYVKQYKQLRQTKIHLILIFATHEISKIRQIQILIFRRERERVTKSF